MQGITQASHGGGEAGVAAFSLSYLNNGSTVLGVVLATANAVLLGAFYGIGWAALWAVCAICLLLVVVVLAVRSSLGDTAARYKFETAQLVLVATWMSSATALWATGDVAASGIAITIPASWAVHIIFTGQGHLPAMIRALVVCTAPMICFLVVGAWTHLPIAAAVAGTVSAGAMLGSISESAQFAHRNFVALQKALAEADATKERLEFAISGAGDGYFEIDLLSTQTTINAGLAGLIGVPAGSAPLDGFRQFVHAEDHDMVFAAIDAARDGMVDGWKQELRIRLATGDWCWMALRSQVIQANAVHGRKLIGTVMDLSASKKIELELRTAKEAAEAHSSAKSQFLANMSHEIRTPLNGVLGMAQALDADSLSTSQKEKVGIILDSGKSLMALLNDVLDLTKIEAGKMEISAVPGDFLHTMKRTRQLFQATAEEKGIDLLVRYDSNFPQRLNYDPTRVRQCVSNLVSNAIKFTASGRVEISLSARRLEEGDFMVAVEVSDTGIGMSEETVGKLFSVFTQADGATTRKFGGSGLGLAISRQLARMMGGDIAASSQLGGGSVFCFTFRAREAAVAPAGARIPQNAEPARKSLRGLRVLLTDDNAINRQVIKLFLAPQGCQIAEATNGKEALDLLAQHEFDIVLLDVHMPVMDGRETIARLRSEPRWKDLPVIALTADAMSGDRERYLGLGMTDYVSKPVDQRELIAKMHLVKGLATYDARPAGKMASGAA